MLALRIKTHSASCGVHLGMSHMNRSTTTVGRSTEISGLVTLTVCPHPVDTLLKDGPRQGFPFSPVVGGRWVSLSATSKVQVPGAPRAIFGSSAEDATCTNQNHMFFCEQASLQMCKCDIPNTTTNPSESY